MAKGKGSIGRRTFLETSVAAVGAVSAAGTPAGAAAEEQSRPSSGVAARRPYNGAYTGEHLNRVAFPLGGHRRRDDLPRGHGRPLARVAAAQARGLQRAVRLRGAARQGRRRRVARVLEGPVPSWKLFGAAGQPATGAAARRTACRASARRRFARALPVRHGDACDDPQGAAARSSSPAGARSSRATPTARPCRWPALEYAFANTSDRPLEAVFSFNARNFLRGRQGEAGGARGAGRLRALVGRAGRARRGTRRSFCARVDDPAAKVNAAWFRGGWFDPLTLAWKDVADGRLLRARRRSTEGGAGAGRRRSSSRSRSRPAQRRRSSLRLSWYVGLTNLRAPASDRAAEAGRAAAARTGPGTRGASPASTRWPRFWARSTRGLREQAAALLDCFYDTTLPPEVVEAVAANLTILKSPTVLRQADGRLWAWEGCGDSGGCCHGSCTHVWNYAQALPHLFPALERTLRETEFGVVAGRARPPDVPRARCRSGPPTHDFHAAADGQLGGIMKVYRDWRISGDTRVAARALAAACARASTTASRPGTRGTAASSRSRTTTPTTSSSGAPTACARSFYLGALRAAVLMGAGARRRACRSTRSCSTKGRARRRAASCGTASTSSRRSSGRTLRAKNPLETKSFGRRATRPRRVALLEKEGPKYQYGAGLPRRTASSAPGWPRCAASARSSTARKVDEPPRARCTATTCAHDLSEHANPQRPTLRLRRRGRAAALHLAARAARSSLPFVYSNEVWTGIEYQVASHLMLMGRVDEGLEIVRACRDRYDGRVRNPFDEYECGHWYARAMSSYALLQGLTRRALRRGRQDAAPRADACAATSAPSSRRRPATARSACATASRSSRCAPAGSR